MTILYSKEIYQLAHMETTAVLQVHTLLSFRTNSHDGILLETGQLSQVSSKESDVQNELAPSRMHSQTWRSN